MSEPERDPAGPGGNPAGAVSDVVYEDPPDIATSGPAPLVAESAIDTTTSA